MRKAQSASPGPAPRAGGAGPGARTTDPAIAVLLLLLALAIRFWFRNPESLWLDEANSVLIARRSLAGIVRALELDGNPPLYYFLLHAWIRLFGEGEAGLRVFSVLLGSLLPPAVYLGARILLRRPGALVAAGLALLWPLHVYDSQQVRMYGLLPCFSLIFLVGLLRALEHERRAGSGSPALPWGVVAASGIALVYTHNYGVFAVLAAPAVWILAGPRTRRACLRLSFSLVCVAAAYLPWMPIVLRQARTDVGAWIAAAFRPDALLRSLGVFGTCVQLVPSGGTLPVHPPGWILSSLWVALVLAGSAGLLLPSPRRRLAAALLAFLLLPLLVPYVISLLGRPIYWVGRYEVVSYPAFTLLIGAGVDGWIGERSLRARGGASRSSPPGARASRRTAGTAAVALLLLGYAALSAFVLGQYRQRPAERTEERIARSLAGWVSPGDVVLLTGLGRAPIEYYLDRMGWGGRLRLESFPRGTAGHLGWYDFTAARNRAAMEREARELAQDLAGFQGKVFLVDQSNFPEFYTLQEPLRRELIGRSARRQVLLRAGRDPKALPLYEVSVYAF